MMRCRCSLALVLALLAAACTTMPPGQPELSGPTSPSVSAVRSPTSIVSDSGSSELSETSAAEPVDGHAPAAPPRSADAAGPFGQADLWIGAGPPPTGLQRPLGPGDLPGPLFDVVGSPPGKFRYMQSWSRVFDRCWQSNEDGTNSGGDYDSLIYALAVDDSAYGLEPAAVRLLGPRCAGSDGHFIAFFGGPWGSEQDEFATRELAQEWVEQRWADVARAERDSVGQPSSTLVFGFYDSVGVNFGWSNLGGPFEIRFAPWDAPVDEVRVLADSVAVTGGVLRGLVRNWSRHRWAYGVTVTAGGGEFSWPLSIQPGEVAPFEIAGWDGPDSPGHIDIGIEADMSWHTDPSRAWGDSMVSAPHLMVRDVAPRPMSGSVRDRYAHVTADVPAGSVSFGTLELEPDLVVPESHLSLRSFREDIVVGDLRGYGALLDADGRVIDVSPAPTIAWTEWGDARSESDYEEITSLPHPLVMDRWSNTYVVGVHVLFDLHAIHAGLAVDSVYDVWEDGAFIVWIGAAHPELDSS